MYTVKEIFLTLQGEGAHVGRVAVFIRFAGCNLWSGREEDRGAGCSAWCDTDFRGGTRYEADQLAAVAAALWPAGGGRRLAVLTGGEPGLQVDEALVYELRDCGFEVAIETNGTRSLPDLDHVTVSPKAGSQVVVRHGQVLKVVYPQPGFDFEALADGFEECFLQPLDGPAREANTAACVAYCLAHPRWRLSLQTHKVLGIR